MDEEIINRYQTLLTEFKANIVSFPSGRFHEKGIVICAGGERLFTCAWICIRRLRRVGCKLPIELWHLGSSEWDSTMEALIQPYDIVCRDALQEIENHPIKNLINWELKPFAILNSSFEEVLYIDADNYVLSDPTSLFEDIQYQSLGSLFWPDRYMGKGSQVLPWLKREAWYVCMLPYRNEVEFEAGQLLINKNICWEALQVCVHLNEHSDFYYYYFYGDKDTFHLAWRIVGLSYGMIQYPNKCFANDALIIQHDPAGNALFQHRNGDKWSIRKSNQKIDAFEYEEEAYQDLEQLKKQWDGFSRSYPEDYNSIQSMIYQEIQDRSIFKCYIENQFIGDWKFNPDFTISESQGNEKSWALAKNGPNKVVLQVKIIGIDGVWGQLWPMDKGIWSGWWMNRERHRIRIEQKSPSSIPV